jgi:MoxR-like ATPase
MSIPHPDPQPAPSAAPILPDQPDDAELRESFDRVRQEVARAVVGQQPAVSGLLIGLLCHGHVLLEGVPGVAKTLLVRALSAALSWTPTACSSLRTSCRGT